MLVINDQITIPDSEFEWSFVRSGGPGGQNVNKVASKAVLRWDFERSPSVPDDVKDRFRERFPSRLTTEGEVSYLAWPAVRAGEYVGHAAPTLYKLVHWFKPGTQLVPARGTRAIAAASTDTDTRSSGSRLCRCDFPHARASVCASSVIVRR